MNGIGNYSITGVGTGAEASVASALIPQNAKPKVTSDTGGTASSSASSTTNTITASDFLTLLVSELKNQDPTQPTDPNAYISQLVGVNSLQQLIAINQGLSAIEPTTQGTTSSSAS
jgi:flagellar basal-body rod modification protein FlgD